MYLYKRLLIYIFSILILLFSNTSYASVTGVSEQEIKAVYLYKLSMFIYFDNKPTKICTLSNREEGESVGSIIKLNIKEKKIEKADNIQIILNPFISEINKCNIVYIDSSKEDLVKDILSAIDNQPIATVSDIKGFLFRGGMFSFVTTKESNIKMQVNYTNASSKKVKIDSTLLNMIKVIY